MQKIKFQRKKEILLPKNREIFRKEVRTNILFCGGIRLILLGR